jgi:hypothetical protein
VLFTVFFLAGATTVVLAILARPELENYFQNRAKLRQLAEQNQRIRELTDQYAAQIALIESEPDILKRFSTSTFGVKPTAPDTVFPESGNEKLRAETERILQTELEPKPIDPIPGWLKRPLDPTIQIALLLSGSALMLITFIFFSAPRIKPSDVSAAD